MSPRAFQTIIVASMGSKDRLELESKVLAAALKQSHARGDSSGVSLAHKQIFLLLRQQQSAEKMETGEQTPHRPEPEPEAETQVEVSSSADESGKKRKRVMPDIVWTEDETGSAEAAESTSASELRDPAASAESDEAVSDDAKNTDDSDRSADRSDTGDDGDSSGSGDDASEGDNENQPAKSADPDSEKPNFNAYGILAVDQIASFEEIHRSFLFLVRRILLTLKKAKRKQRKPLLDELQNLWIAHDILSDPVTRTDFDFRVLGLRGAPDMLIHSAPEDKSDSISSRTPLRIGELMQCAGLLEPTELEIAADMHKAMPEMLFGAFLVKQGFISEEDLGQVLTGQRLLKNGNMTVGHYQMCMKSWRENRVPIEETAVSEGLVTQQEMDRVIASGQRDTTSGVPAYQSGNATLRATAPHINQEEAAKRKFSAGHAVPVWKDQLDWSEPEAIQAYVDDEPDYEHRKKVESSLDIEGITDAVTNKDGKKSLRRLMEGIHSSPDSTVAEEGAVSKSLKNIFGTTADSAPQGPVGGDRLAAGTADKPVEESIAADAVAAEQGLKDAQAGGASSQHDSFNQPDSAAQDSRSGEALSEALAKALKQESSPTIEVPMPKIRMEEGSRSAIQPDDGLVFGEVDYDDEDDAVGDMDDLAYSMDDTDAIDSDSELTIEHYAMTPSSVTETASIESPSVESDNMDDLLDFSTSSDIEPPSEIRKVLDQAFHGVRTTDTEVIVVNQELEAPSPMSIDVPFEALPGEASDMESGVFPNVQETAPHSEQLHTEDNHQEVAVPESVSASTDGGGGTAEIRLSSIIIESVEQEDVADELTDETLAAQADDESTGETLAAKALGSDEPSAELKQSKDADHVLDSQLPVASVADETFAYDTASEDGESRETTSMELPAVTQTPGDQQAELAVQPYEIAAEDASTVEQTIMDGMQIVSEDQNNEAVEQTSTGNNEAIDQTITVGIQSVAGVQNNEAVEQTSTGGAQSVAGNENNEAIDQTITVGIQSVAGDQNDEVVDQTITGGMQSVAGDQNDEVVDQTITGGMQSVAEEQNVEIRATSAYVVESSIDSASESEIGASTTSVNEIELGSTADGIIQSENVSEENPAKTVSGSGDQEDQTAVNPQDDQSSSEDTQNPPVVNVTSSSDKSAQIATGDNDTVKLTDVSGSFPGIAPLEENPSSRLKSGEWQIVYKLEGSIADAFLSEEEEKEMPKMRPRLTEIDSIIPSSITKLAKGDTTGSGTSDSAADQDEGKGNNLASDKPVIKPVSMNYNRADKTKNEKGAKGDKGDKGHKGKKD